MEIATGLAAGDPDGVSETSRRSPSLTETIPVAVHVVAGSVTVHLRVVGEPFLSSVKTRDAPPPSAVRTLIDMAVAVRVFTTCEVDASTSKGAPAPETG